MGKLLSIEELSEMLGIPVSTLYAWTCKKKIPYVKLGRLVRFREGEIMEWIAKNTVHPAQVCMIPEPDRNRRRRSLARGAGYIDSIVKNSKEAVLGARRGCDRM